MGHEIEISEHLGYWSVFSSEEGGAIALGRSKEAAVAAYAEYVESMEDAAAALRNGDVFVARVALRVAFDNGDTATAEPQAWWLDVEG